MKHYRLLLTAILLTFVGRMLADNLSVENVTMGAGETKEVAIQLSSPANKYVAFQFDLVLPEGISIVKNSKGEYAASLESARIDGHTMTVSEKTAGTYRFLSYSMTNGSFKGTEGAFVNVTLQADESIAVGTKTATIKSQVFTDESGEIFKWEDASFSITIKPAVVPNITADDKTREYGEENPELTYQVSDPITGEPLLTTTATKTSPVGEYDIVVERGTVEGEITTANGKLTITKAPLTISGGEYTIKQGDALPAFVATYAGFKNGETSAVLTKQPTLTTTATSTSTPGTYEVTVSGAEAENYEISYVAGSLTITEADPVTVTAKNYTREYGEANPTFEYTSEGATLNGTPEISCEATAASPVGTYPIVIKKGGVTNYNDTYVNGTLTITKAPLTIKAGMYTRKQGEENPEFTLSYEGFKNGETEAVLTKQPTVTCNATKESAVGDYEVKVSGAEAQNYEISYVNGTLKVTDADAVIVTAKNYTRVYGDANPTFEYEVSGATLEGQPEISCEATATSPVGTYPITIKKGSVTNYNDTYVNGTLTITRTPLTVTVGNYTRQEGEDNPEFVITYEGWKNNEDESVLTTKPVASTVADKESATGDYPITVAGGEALNYSFTYVGGTLTVTPKPEDIILDVTIDHERATGLGYTPTEAEVDFTEAKSWLGVDAITTDMLYFENPDGTLIDYATYAKANYDGWCNGEGAAENWGNTTMVCVKFFEAIPDGKFTFYDMNGADEDGKTYTVRWRLVNREKVVRYTINVTFKKPAATELEVVDKGIVASVTYDIADADYAEQKVTLTDEQVAAICAELGISDLSEATAYGYNPTAQELVKNYAGFDGWRDANGDFHNWNADGTQAPACVKYTDGKEYLCYNRSGMEPQTIKTFWAIANDKKAVLVEIDFIYLDATADPDNTVKNWNCSGSDVSSFWVHEWRTMDAQADGPANIVDGCVKVYVRSFAQAEAAGNATLKDGNKENMTLDNFADWDSQFFITWDEAKATAAGDKLQLKMKVKGDKAQTIASQLHKAPGAYVHWYAVGDINVTTEWTDFVSAEVDVVSGDPGYGKTAEGCWTIAFNLAKGEENTFYFDDMVVYVIKPTGITEMYRINAEDGVRYNLAGKRVDDSYKGIVIMNGKKMLQK